MPLSKAHKARSRQHILAAAAASFRARGYRGAGVDEIMGRAGLTRGGFYAHFPSKAALFAEVLRGQHGLNGLLARRTATDVAALKTAGRAILRDYVAPAHAAVVGAGCTLANLLGDAARGGAGARRAFAAALEDLAAALARGEGPDRRAQALAAVALVVGAVALARGCRGTSTAPDLLTAAHALVDGMLDAPLEPARPTRRRARPTPRP